MKKLFLLILVSLLVSPLMVNADETYYINNGKTTITAEEYLKLQNLGFEAKEIYGMPEEEFNKNKNLTGEIVKKTTLDLSEFPQLSLNPDESLGGEIISPQNSAYAQTEYKRMSVYIINVNDNHYRYKITLDWIRMPSKRSWDILALGYENTVKIAIPTSFSQEWCKKDGCYTSLSGNYYSYDDVEMVSFKLPSGTLTSLNSYMLYDVLRVDSTKVLESITTIGDYAHATSTLSNSLSKSDIQFYDEIWLTNHAVYYDDIQAINLSQTVNWGA